MHSLQRPWQRVATIVGVACVLLAATLLTVSVITKAGVASATSPCATKQHSYSADVAAPSINFGPAAPTAVKAALSELHTRRCADALLFVSHQENVDNAFTDAQSELDKMATLQAHPDFWAAGVSNLEKRESGAVRVEVTTASGDYMTQAMQKSAFGPYLVVVHPNRPTFQVLKFTWADGSTEMLKLDCGFQPVRVSFPGMGGTPHHPGTPHTPPPTTGSTVPPGTPTTVKCAHLHKFGGKWYCGTPSSGPEQNPRTDPGRTPGAPPVGHAEHVAGQQTPPSDPYHPNPQYGSNPPPGQHSPPGKDTAGGATGSSGGVGSPVTNPDPGPTVSTSPPNDCFDHPELCGG